MKSRNAVIDIIKGICIILVVFTHYDWTGEEIQSFYFVFWVDQAVPMFMIVSGYLYALSYKRNCVDAIDKAYEVGMIINKIIRYTLPFLVIFFIEMVAAFITNKGTIFEILCSFFSGGWGPGSFYFPVMIQFVFLFPIIYFMVKKYEFFGVIIIGILNFVYEIVKEVFYMPNEQYRLLIFRYVLLIGFGCFMAIGEKIPRKTVAIISIIVGGIWLFSLNNLDYKPSIINEQWASTSCLSALWVMPIAWLFIKKERERKFKFKILEHIGKASYNIYLIQMIYFISLANVVYIYINLVWLRLVINVVFCITVGYVFYLLENKITQKVVDCFESNNYYLDAIAKVVEKSNLWFTKDNSS